MTLSPEAVVKLYQECLDYARKHKLGIFGIEPSKKFIDKLDKEFDKTFSKSKENGNGCND